mgnify:CR=1 FL=1
MVNGILLQLGGETGKIVVKHAFGGTESELLEKHDEIREHNELFGEYGFSHFSEPTDGKNWEYDTGKGMLDIDSVFTSRFHILLSMIAPWFLEVTHRTDRGYPWKWGLRKNKLHSDLIFRTYNTQRHYDGLGRPPQMAWVCDVMHHNQHISRITVICGWNAYSPVSGDLYEDLDEFFNVIDTFSTIMRDGSGGSINYY